MTTEVAKAPIGRGWTVVDPFRGVWVHDSGITVVSTLDHAEYPDGSGEVGPQWHVSISRIAAKGPPRPVRPDPRDVELALASFDMVAAEEDNHEPGMARHFWVPVDPARRVDCQCAATEDTIVEPDGHTWTNPRVGTGECRGCSQAILFARRGLPPRPCPIHSKGARP